MLHAGSLPAAGPKASSRIGKWVDCGAAGPVGGFLAWACADGAGVCAPVKEPLAAKPPTPIKAKIDERSHIPEPSTNDSWINCLIVARPGSASAISERGMIRKI